MFVLFALLCLFHQTTGDEVRYKCSENGESMKFTAEPSVRGRYTLELCTPRNPNVTEWYLDLMYYEGARCSKNPTRFRVHSTLKGLPISSPDNCTNVCYSVDFDLIFTACYKVYSELKDDERTLQSKEAMFVVQNNMTSDSYRQSKMKVLYIAHDKVVTLEFISAIPISYQHSICIEDWNNHTNEYTESCRPNLANCTLSSVYRVFCTMALQPACYKASLNLEPAWYPLFHSLTGVYYEFCVQPYAPPVLGGAGGGVAGTAAYWAAGGVLAACALALVALAARRAMRAREFHKRVIMAWRGARENIETARVVEAEPLSHTILLLYAREGELGQRAVDALKQLLQHEFDGQVLDLYSAAVVSAAAPAPGAWLRGVLQSARTKVLLLQSPALLQLYHTTVKDDTLRLSEPLLGRKSVYRAPHFGDQLLLLALRLAADSVGAHHLYRKYYLAGYGGLPGDILPSLVPYRRYELPHAVTTLLHDIGGDPAPAPACPGNPAPASPDTAAHTEHLLEQLSVAADEFVGHAQAHPNYLSDELVLM